MSHPDIAMAADSLNGAGKMLKRKLREEFGSVLLEENL